MTAEATLQGIQNSGPTPGSSGSLPADTKLGHVELTVADLDRQIGFYQTVLGFALNWREGDRAGLGAGDGNLLRLVERPSARRHRGTTGMYHFALLYPSRKELARAIARLFALRYPNAPTDHVVSQTTYLDDLEGNTIELYVRTLEEGTMEEVDGQLVARRADGRSSNGREPLDLDSLSAELTEDDPLDLPLPVGTQLGHVHLYAASLADSVRFYGDVLGFDPGLVSASFRMGDVGLSAEQPHVIAFNTWQGEGAPSPPAESLGIRHFTVVLPDSSALELTLGRLERAGLTTTAASEGRLVRDPAGIPVILALAG